MSDLFVRIVRLTTFSYSQYMYHYVVFQSG